MCTKTKSKVILIAFNFLFWTGGCVMLGFGIWMKVDPEAVINYVRRINVQSSDPLVSYAAIMFIVIGSLAFFVGFLGLCGAYNDKTSMLILYSCLLVLFMIAEVSAVTLIVIYQAKVDESLQDEHLKAFANDGLFNDAAESIWNHVQTALKCCGINGYGDYSNFTWWSPIKSSLNTSDEVFVPDSCCVRGGHERLTESSGKEFNDRRRCQEDAKQKVKKSRYLHVEGCKAPVQNWILRHTVAMIVLASGIFAFELFGCIAASCLCLLLKKSSDKDEND